MPRDAYDPEPHRGRTLAALRAVGFACAVVLAVVAVWLIVTGTTQKRIEIGVLAGLWGLLLGAFAVFGSRHPRAIEYDPEPGGELELRVRTQVEREDDAAARRHYEARLEHMLRREIQTTMARELAALHAEVASLRTELLDKVGGQLRLERIETTRVIGSDIEALQHEISQLKTVREISAADQPPRPMARLANAIVVEPEQRVEPPAVNPPVAAAPPMVEPAAVPAPMAEQVPMAEPVPVAEPVPMAEPAPEPPLSVPDAGAAPVGNDPFAALPRLRPFSDLDLDPGQPLVPPGDGLRREVAEAAAPSARHADRAAGAADASAQAEQAAARTSGSGGGRRRRAPGDHNDVLAQILQREGVHR